MSVKEQSSIDKIGNSVVLYLGDCLDKMAKMPDGYIDLLVTDPPYRLTSRGNEGNSGGMMKESATKNGSVFNHNSIKCKEYAPEFYRVLKDGSHCYVMCNNVNLIDMLNVFSSCGFHFIKTLIWDKCRKIMGTHYMGQYEYILFFRKGMSVKINNCGTGDILSIPGKKTKGADGKNIHNTEKPVELMQVLVENSSKVGGIVLDPFMGVGSTGIACINSDRKFIGIELDENYYHISKKRIQHAQSNKQLNMLDAI